MVWKGNKVVRTLNETHQVRNMKILIQLVHLTLIVSQARKVITTVQTFLVIQ